MLKNNLNYMIKIISAGHSVGNHSMTHLNGWKVDKKKYLS